MKRVLVCASFLICSVVFGDSEESQEEEKIPSNCPRPWFTGPLLTSSADVVDFGHVNFQPYMNVLTTVGDYDPNWHLHRRANFYTLQSRNVLKFGIYHSLEVQVIPQFLYKETEGKRFSGLGDTFVALGVQLLRGGLDIPWPFIKISFVADIPNGHYQHLNPWKKKTDAMGAGCWFPGSVLYLSKTWHIAKHHYLNLRTLFDYRFGVPVRVRGFNAYGGDRSTRGTQYPGNYWHANVALQYSLTQRWVLACDGVYLHRNRNRFSGKTKEQMTFPSRDVYSLAPAIEYNFGPNVGMIGGVWFSVVGRNTEKFITAMLSLNAHF